RAEICDTAELTRARGSLGLRGERVDLVYWRDTDFALAAPRSRAVRDAYLAREVVVTPAPREHHLLANKRRLELFSSREALLQLAAGADDAAHLAAVIPETVGLAALGRERAWRERRAWVFKPSAW